jgi:lipopolysaccharide export system permease protein
MLFHSSLRRELGRSFGASFLVLLTIVITMLLIRTLGLAHRGSVNPEEILLVLTYTVIGRLPTVLTLALFIAVVSTLSRMYRDSEMVIWFASGKGVGDFLAPVFRFAWPIVTAIVVLVLLAWPWANAQTEALRERYEQRGDLERVAPGQFQESSGGRRVFFIEKDTVDGAEGRNVFISNTSREGRESVTSARAGRVEWIEDQQMLLLEQGQRLEWDPQDSQAGVRLSEFGLYGVQVGSSPLVAGGANGLKARSTWALIRDPQPAHAGELSWRIGMGLTALNFTLMGVAVAAGNPRAGRSGNLLFMLFAFVVYYNLLNLGQSWVANGQVGWLPLMVGLHGTVFALCAGWLVHRHRGWRLQDWVRPLGRKAAP